MRITLSFAMVLLAAQLYASEQSQRIVAAGGAVTEIIYALGAGNRVVGVDTSSLYPQSATELPQVGYVRTLSAEGILSLRPTLLIAGEDAGPPATLAQLEAAGVRIVKIPNALTPQAAAERIRAVADALSISGNPIDALLHEFEENTAAARVLANNAGQKPRVLFIYARGGGVMNVAGAATEAGAIISLAGGQNAITGMSGYKPLTAEAALGANPDFILMTSRGLKSIGGTDGVFQNAALLLTRAGRDKRIISMDDLLLLGFGPRLDEAILDLAKMLHPDLATPTR